MVDISKVSFGGQDAGEGAFESTWADHTTLFLKVFAGEVLTAFERTNIMMPLHTVRTISSGKSAQFPVTGTASTDYFVPGKDILIDTGYLSNIQHNERVIKIDDLLISSVFIDQLDEARNHYDVRGIYSAELGRALGKKMDQQLIQLVINAAKEGATAPQAAGGGTTFDADFASSTESAVGTIFEIAQGFDERDVPAEDRVLVLNPASYYNLVQANEVISSDYDTGGSFKEGSVTRVAGFEVHMSNNIPTEEKAAEDGANNTYDSSGSAVFAATQGIAFHKGAIGTVKLMDLAMESEYLINRQGHLMVAKLAVGHGILRPEMAVQITNA